MANVLRHADWYLIAGQCFRRRAGISESRQVFRGEPALVLSDTLTGQHLRLTHRAAAVWRRLDGRTTVQDIWRDLTADRADAPSQRDVIDWITQMVTTGMLLSDHSLSAEALGRRTNTKRDQLVESRLGSPLAIKVALFDPSWLIRVTYPLVRPLLSCAGLGLLLALWLWAALAAVLHWPQIVDSTDNAVLSQGGIVALVLGYPVMKLLHELSHGWVLHHFGGKVREAGVMLLIFFPVPYVDASDANRLPDKTARMLVSLAGVLAEVTVAAVACLIWVQMEPGLPRAILFSLMIMGTVSTLFFNGNPLLKFDSYFALADALEIPNLAKRAGDHLRDRFCDRVLGLRAETRVAPDIAPILHVYGTLSLLYRLGLSLSIAFVVAQLFFGLGVAIAVWALVQSTVVPLWRLGRHAVRLAVAQRREGRATGRAMVALLLIGALLGAVPLPQTAIGRGQAVAVARAELRVGGAGFVTTAALSEGQMVAADAPLLTLDNPEQDARRVTATIARDSLRTRLAQGNLSVAERRAGEEQLRLAEAALAEIIRQGAERVLIAPASGRLSWEGGRPPVLGRFLTKGDRVGHVLAADAVEIVVAFDPASLGGVSDVAPDIALLWPDGTQGTGRWTRTRTLDMGAVVPPELRSTGGGPVAVLPDDPSRALLPVHLFWLTAAPAQGPLIGQPVVARISLPPSPLAAQLLRRAQQVLPGLFRG